MEDFLQCSLEILVNEGFFQNGKKYLGGIYFFRLVLRNWKWLSVIAENIVRTRKIQTIRNIEEVFYINVSDDFFEYWHVDKSVKIQPEQARKAKVGAVRIAQNI